MTPHVGFVAALIAASAVASLAGPFVSAVAADEFTPGTGEVTSGAGAGTEPASTVGDSPYDHPTVAEPASVVPSDPPACRYADISAVIDPAAPELTPLDTAIALKRAYNPTDLVPVARAGLQGGGSIRRVVLPDLRAMVSAARRDGVTLAAVSAFRNYATQVVTFSRWSAVVGPDRVRLYSARPGHSEHQLGTTLDFAAHGGPRPWTYRDWAKTRAGAWVAANGWRYGFVMTYPRAGSPAISCYEYEPWHWRWLGRDVARAIHADAVMPRVWLWRRATQR